jgi:hypothetical protein
LISLSSSASISSPPLIANLHFNHLLVLKNQKQYVAGKGKHKKKSCGFGTKNSLIEMNIQDPRISSLNLLISLPISSGISSTSLIASLHFNHLLV